MGLAGDCSVCPGPSRTPLELARAYQQRGVTNNGQTRDLSRHFATPAPHIPRHTGDDHHGNREQSQSQPVHTQSRYPSRHFAIRAAIDRPRTRQSEYCTREDNGAGSSDRRASRYGGTGTPEEIRTRQRNLCSRSDCRRVNAPTSTWFHRRGYHMVLHRADWLGHALLWLLWSSDHHRITVHRDRHPDPVRHR